MVKSSLDRQTQTDSGIFYISEVNLDLRKGVAHDAMVELGYVEIV
jgi:hypothetical protein